MDSPFSQVNSYVNSLPRSKGSFDLGLVVRLVIASLLVAVALLVDMLPAVRIILMVLSALVAGYDIVLDLIDAIYAGDYFSPPVLLVFVAVLSFLIGYGWEGALLAILYQLGTALVAYAAAKTKRSAQELLSLNDPELAEKASVLIKDRHAGETRFEKEIGKALSIVLKGLIALAFAFAVAMPIFTELSVRESIHRAMIMLTIAMPASVLAAIPLSGIVGMSYATRFGTLFHNAEVLEKLRQVNTAVVDKSGIFADSKLAFIGVKSDILDEKTFMEFVAHAVYYSDQPFAKAILAAEDRDYRLDLISDFHDIPGSGVDVNIGGTKVTLARRELLADRGEAVPYEGKEENSVYYLMVSGKYIGKVLLAENLNKENTELIGDLKRAGMEKCVLLTEDSRDESERLGTSLNADEVYAEFSDETKLRYLESLDSQETMYIYANSLETHSSAAVDVRVSSKGKYADALVSPSSLKLFPNTLQISRRMYEINAENAIFAVVVKAVLLFLAITGNCTVWFAIFLDFVAALATVLNVIRVTKAPLFALPKLFK